MQILNLSLNDAPAEKVKSTKAIATTGGSFDQAPIIAPNANANADVKGGSTEDVKAAPAKDKKLEISGSVVDEKKKDKDKKTAVKSTEKGSVD